MRLRSPAPWILLLAACLPATAPGQARHRLRERQAAGDDSTQKMILSLTQRVKADMEGQPAQTYVVNVQSRTVYAETILAVNSQGEPTASRRRYTIAEETETGTEGRKRKVSSLQGKTITARLVGSQVVLRVAKGSLAAEDRKDLEEELRSPDLRFFPDHDLAVGEEWDIDIPNPSRIFKNAEKVTLHGRLMAVEMYAGRQCARARLTVHVAGKVESDSPLHVEAELTGDIHHALDIQRTLAVNVAGPLTIRGETQAQGQTIRLAGSGTMRLKVDIAWRRVAGRSVGR